MGSNQDNSVPTVGLSSSKWHLLGLRPDAKCIPKTHRYREISHEEFRLLSRYLNVYKSFGKIIVADALSDVILPRLTGLEVEQSGWRWPGKYDYSRIPSDLGENDHVLVAYGTVSGMYVQISYARADPAKFREMVVTGIIEPKKTEQATAISRLMVAAEKIMNNFKRIAEAEKIARKIDNSSGDLEQMQKKEHLSELIKGFKAENDTEIEISSITPRLIDEAISAIEKELDFLQKEGGKRGLLVQIEDSLKLTNQEEHRATLAGARQAITENIQQHERQINNLKGLREYLLLRAVGDNKGTPIFLGKEDENGN